MAHAQPLTVWMTETERCLLWDRVSWDRFADSFTKNSRDGIVIRAAVSKAIERSTNNRAVQVTLPRAAADALLARQPRR